MLTLVTVSTMYLITGFFYIYADERDIYQAKLEINGTNTSFVNTDYC